MSRWIDAVLIAIFGPFVLPYTHKRARVRVEAKKRNPVGRR